MTTVYYLSIPQCSFRRLSSSTSLMLVIGLLGFESIRRGGSIAAADAAELNYLFVLKTGFRSIPE